MQAEINEGMTFIYYGKSLNGAEYSTMVTTNEDALPEVVQRFKEFLLACGFSPKSIDEYIEHE